MTELQPNSFNPEKLGWVRKEKLRQQRIVMRALATEICFDSITNRQTIL
jgi:hypothetical protein